MITQKKKEISPRVIGRLSVYRRSLNRLAGEGVTDVHSHELASMARVSAAQVRRDLMVVGYQGSPTKGYAIVQLLANISELLDAPEAEGVALVGVGNLGRAILAYFAGRRPKLSIVAAFDNDPSKVGRMMHGCPCYPGERMNEIISQNRIRTAIVAVPASVAQAVVDELVRCGVRGILNFAPVRLRVPAEVYVEDFDMAVGLEKVAYFARQYAPVSEGEKR